MPEQPHLFPPTEVVNPTASMTLEQEAEYDRLDAIGRTNAAQIRQEVGAIATREPGSEFWTEESDLTDATGKPISYEYAEPKPNETGKPLKSRSRRGLSGAGRLIADGPPAEYDGR